MADSRATRGLLLLCPWRGGPETMAVEVLLGMRLPPLVRLLFGDIRDPIDRVTVVTRPSIILAAARVGD